MWGVSPSATSRSMWSRTGVHSKSVAAWTVSMVDLWTRYWLRDGVPCPSCRGSCFMAAHKLVVTSVVSILAVSVLAFYLGLWLCDSRFVLPYTLLIILLRCCFEHHQKEINEINAVISMVRPAGKYSILYQFSCTALLCMFQSTLTVRLSRMWWTP